MTVVQLNVNGKIESDGHLHLDVVTSLPAGEAEITLTIRSEIESKAHRYDFSSLAGKLAWRGDAVAKQREIRDEW